MSITPQLSASPTDAGAPQLWHDVLSKAGTTDRHVRRYLDTSHSPGRGGGKQATVSDSRNQRHKISNTAKIPGFRSDILRASVNEKIDTID